MSKKKQHFDIDLDFLDNNSTSKISTKNDKTGLSTSTKESKYNWKKIIVIGTGALFFIWAIFSSDTPSDNSTGSNSSKDADTVQNGLYNCSVYHSEKADSLEPNETEDQLNNLTDSLESRGNELDRLKNELDNTYVNEYSSQYQINLYNDDVDYYNNKLEIYKQDLANLDARIDKFNAQTKVRNEYLIENCTPD